MQLPSHKNRGGPFRGIWRRPCPFYIIHECGADASFWAAKVKARHVAEANMELNNGMELAKNACDSYNTVTTY